MNLLLLRSSGCWMFSLLRSLWTVCATCKLPSTPERWFWHRPSLFRRSDSTLLLLLLFSSPQLPGDAVHGHRPRQADEAGEVNRGQGAVPCLSDAQRTQGDRRHARVRTLLTTCTSVGTMLSSVELTWSVSPLSSVHPLCRDHPQGAWTLTFQTVSFAGEGLLLFFTPGPIHPDSHTGSFSWKTRDRMTRCRLNFATETFCAFKRLSLTFPTRSAAGRTDKILGSNEKLDKGMLKVCHVHTEWLVLAHCCKAFFEKQPPRSRSKVPTY